MKSISDNNERGSAHLVLVAVAVVLLIGLLGFLYWNNFVNFNSQTVSDNTVIKDDEVYSKPDTWLTYDNGDIPYTFDYPDTLHIEKKVSSYNEGGNSGKHITTTLQLLAKDNNMVANIRYETGTKFVSDGTPCRTGKSVTVTSKTFSSSKIEVCDEDGNKYWTVSDTNDSGNESKALLHLFAKGEKDGGFNLSTFSKIIKSINKENSES